MPISDHIRRDVQSVAPAALCDEAARLMRDARVGSLVVVEEGRPVGMLTDRDLVVKVIAAGKAPAEVAVRDVMSSKPIFVSESRGIDQALEAMADLAVRRIPVVDAEQKLIGIVALDDLLVLLADQLSRAASTIRKEM